MYFLFITEDCLTCSIALEILKKKDEAGSVQIVYVKFNQKKRIFETFIDGKNKGKAPVQKVPAFYSASDRNVLFGEDAIEGIINANWKN